LLQGYAQSLQSAADAGHLVAAREPTPPVAPLPADSRSLRVEEATPYRNLDLSYWDITTFTAAPE
jgi:hypothetical protein